MFDGFDGFGSGGAAANQGEQTLQKIQAAGSESLMQGLGGNKSGQQPLILPAAAQHSLGPGLKSNPSQLSESPYSNIYNPQHALTSSFKFKKKSQIEEQALSHILDSKPRISINTKTGQHEFIYSNKPSNQASGSPYVYNSDSVVNCIRDSNGLEQMEPIRPSKLIWQMPYEERKSFM